MTAALDLSLYLVLDAQLLGPRDLPATLAAALAGGVRVVQLRDKHGSPHAVLASARQIQSLLAGSGVPLIINDHVDVAAEIGADGVHVGQSDMSLVEVRRSLSPRAIVGLSITSLEQLAADDLALADYVGLGPIFPTASKPDAAPALGLEAIRRARRQLAAPLVAIGGIDAGNASDVIEAGADGVAVVSAICAAADPRAAALALRRAVDAGRRRASAYRSR
jgi:thiamine-phosphate pyrophosphorylase